MELIAHLSKQAGDNIAEGEETEPSSSKGKKEKAEKEVMQVVRELNMTDFEGLSEEDDAWLVAFYAGNDHAVMPRGGVSQTTAIAHASRCSVRVNRITNRG